MSTADRLDRLEHIQRLQTTMLHALVADLSPTDRARLVDRFRVAAAGLPPVGDDADAAGAAWCAALLDEVRRWQEPERTLAGGFALSDFGSRKPASVRRPGRHRLNF